MTTPTPPVRADNGDPAADPVGTVRVHPLDDPRDRTARRVICTDEPTHDLRWDLFSGTERVNVDDDDATDEVNRFFRTDGEVRDWRVQPLWHLAAVLDHHPALQLDVDLLEREFAAGYRRGEALGQPENVADLRRQGAWAHEIGSHQHGVQAAVADLARAAATPDETESPR